MTADLRAGGQRRIVAVSAGLSEPSSTRMLADRLGAAVRDALPGAEVTTIELRALAHPIADAMLTGFPSGALREAVDAVTGADGLILVTPTFTASYSGLFKSFVDVLDQDALRAKPVLAAATGGTERHSLMIDHALRPLLAYLHADVAPTAVYAASGDWGAPGLDERITRAGGELAALIERRPAQEPVRDEFADPVPFAQLLGR